MDICENKKACKLSDEINARHFTRKTSCSKECMGFNWHPSTGHCTLFADNMKLLHGGRGHYYGRPGFTKPEFGTLELFIRGEGVAAKSFLRPFSLIIGMVTIANFGFLAVRSMRQPRVNTLAAGDPNAAEE